MAIMQLSRGNSSIQTLLREGLKVQFTPRGFPFIIIKDKYYATIRVQQSSADMNDIWLFVEEPSAYMENYGNNDILLTTENLNDINLFKKYIEGE